MPNRLRVNWPPAALLITSAGVIAADQLTKNWIRAHVPYGQSLCDLGFFRITHLTNTGAAFGMFPGHATVMIIISILGVILLLACACFTRGDIPVVSGTAGRLALGLALGGTAGNLIDRVRLGYVTDFIHFSFWPTFNIADSAVTIGALTLAFLLLRHSFAPER